MSRGEAVWARNGEKGMWSEKAARPKTPQSDGLSLLWAWKKAGVAKVKGESHRRSQRKEVARWPGGGTVWLEVLIEGNGNGSGGFQVKEGSGLTCTEGCSGCGVNNGLRGRGEGAGTPVSR